jgi:prepilin-type N-terminal cleavage/methylation domain-containing protein/prepilin-type processing-associated H-X9-DG protein
MLRRAHRCRFRPFFVGGFTLLELLVVISVLSLLVAMLFPSLKGARAQAHRVVCGSRLRQWGIAFCCYAAENDALWPHCDALDRGPDDLDDPNISPEDVADWHGWVDVLPPLMALTPWRDHPRYGYPDEKTFYQCPIGRAFEGSSMYSYRPQRDGYFSYSMNSCLELDANAWPPCDGIGYPMPSFLSTARIVSPQRLIVLYDQLLDPRKGFDAEMVYRGAGKYCGSYPKAFSARHRSGADELGGNILYGDGHVEWQRSVWKEDWDPAMEVPPRDDPDWYPYPPQKAPR